MILSEYSSAKFGAARQEHRGCPRTSIKGVLLLTAATSALDKESASKRVLPVIAHCQTTTLLQPALARASSAFKSRVALASTFARQNSVRVAGNLYRWQSCPCQKQPCTKITVRQRDSTTSGEPGKRRTDVLNRNPARWSKLRTVRSGDVSRWRTLAIRTLRSVVDNLSATVSSI